MNAPVVRRLEPHEWELARAVRLAALAESPAAFSSTLARESAFAEAEWRARVTGNPWLLAWVGDEPVGMACCLGTTNAGEKFLAAMWVAPEHRGRGAADLLVAGVVAAATEQHATRVTLWVVGDNAKARRLYARHGFVATGRVQPHPGNPEGEIEMALEM